MARPRSKGKAASRAVPNRERDGLRAETARPKTPGSARQALRWAAGLAVLAASTVTLLERVRARRGNQAATVPASGRGRPQGAPSAEAARHGYETNDTDVRALTLIMTGAIVLIVAGVAAVFTMYASFARHDLASGQPMTVEQQATIVPPEPHLQADPFQDIATQRRQQQQALTTYGWADASHRQAHIPIARAMALVVGRPLDAIPAPADGASPMPGQDR